MRCGRDYRVGKGRIPCNRLGRSDYGPYGGDADGVLPAIVAPSYFPASPSEEELIAFDHFWQPRGDALYPEVDISVFSFFVFICL